MDAAGKRRPAPGRGPGTARLRSALVRTAAWIVAVPLLCATVIVGGAVPLYLFLPEAGPRTDAPAAAPKSRSVASAPAANPPPETLASAAPSPRPPEPAAGPEVAPAPAAAADEPPAEAAGDDPPAPDAAASSPPEVKEEREVAAVIPTPRPEPPRPVAPEAARPAATETRQEASLEPAPPPGPERPDRGAVATSKAAGGRAVILRTVTVRSGPAGRELGVLKQGSPVTVGRCEEWCEVRGDGASGWVHSSFLADSLPDRRGGAVASRREDAVVARRIARPRVPDAPDDQWLDEGLGYYDGYDRPVARRAPRWVYEEEHPRVVRRQAPPRFYDPYDGPYD